MTKRKSEAVKSIKKENKFVKFLRKNRDAIVISLIFSIATLCAGIPIQIAIQNYQPKELVGVVYRKAYEQTATLTITPTISVSLIVRSSNGTIISNSTG
jgi:hypothetical protein